MAAVHCHGHCTRGVGSIARRVRCGRTCPAWRPAPCRGRRCHVVTPPATEPPARPAFGAHTTRSPVFYSFFRRRPAARRSPATPVSGGNFPPPSVDAAPDSARRLIGCWRRPPRRTLQHSTRTLAFCLSDPCPGAEAVTGPGNKAWVTGSGWQGSES